MISPTTGENIEDNIGPDSWTQIVGDNPWKEEWEKQWREIQLNTIKNNQQDILIYTSLFICVSIVIVSSFYIVWVKSKKKYKHKK